MISSDAEIVLPYDPLTDRVLLVEQFRVGPHLRGDTEPWCVELIAGLIGPGETPEQAAIRKAKKRGWSLHQTAGVDLANLSLSSIINRVFHLYVDLVDLPAVSQWVAGLMSEAEDIRSHIFSFINFIQRIDAVHRTKRTGGFMVVATPGTLACGGLS